MVKIKRTLNYIFDKKKEFFIPASATITMAVFLCICDYVQDYKKTGVWGRSQQKEILAQQWRADSLKQGNERKRKEEARLNYESHYNRLFYLADRDTNEIVSVEEQIEAWRRMDLISERIIMSEGLPEFPKPSLSDLEKGIESYKRETN